ncbi:MAG: amidohydrolase family protein [Candidatus Natronoplasma sp.]
MSLAIIDTELLTFEGSSVGAIKNGAVGIEENELVFVGKSRELNEKDYEEIIDGSNHITMPGLVDAHIHTGLSLLRGAAQDVPEKEWMNQALGPIARHMDEEDKIASSRLTVLEALRCGTTTFAEFSEGVKELIDDVYLPYSVRVAVAETINEVAGSRNELYELESSKEKLQENEQLFEDYEEVSLVEPLYGPQALDMVTSETLKEIKRRAESENRKIHMHVAQGGREREQIRDKYDTSTVKKLDEMGLLGENLIAAHCHGASQEEMELMADKGVKMVGCPSSIGMIDGVVPPVKSFLDHGGKAALGSDQTPGSGAHNIFREMRTISLLSKCENKDPTALPAWKALKLGTKGGSEVLGLDEKIGTLEEGKRADVITLDLKKLNMTPTVYEPFRNFIPNLVYSTTGLEVDNVIIDGKRVLREGEFTDIDEESVIEEAEERAKKLYQRAGEDWREANSQMVQYRKEGNI